jgi:hypothetical protein
MPPPSTDTSPELQLMPEIWAAVKLLEFASAARSVDRVAATRRGTAVKQSWRAGNPCEKAGSIEGVGYVINKISHPFNAGCLSL